MPEREGQQVDREVGRTKDASFQIGVSRTVPHDAAAVWELLTSSVGLAVWLGELTELPTAPGQPYGTTSEIRSFRPIDRSPAVWRLPNATYDRSALISARLVGE